MNLLETIEKLINEHGSATILGERLAQAKEQYALLEKSKADADAKVALLESQLQMMQRRNQDLTEQMANFQAARDNPPGLNVISTMPEADYSTPSDG